MGFVLFLETSNLGEYIQTAINFNGHYQKITTGSPQTETDVEMYSPCTLILDNLFHILIRFFFYSFV